MNLEGQLNIFCNELRLCHLVYDDDFRRQFSLSAAKRQLLIL